MSGLSIRFGALEDPYWVASEDLGPVTADPLYLQAQWLKVSEIWKVLQSHSGLFCLMEVRYFIV